MDVLLVEMVHLVAQVGDGHQVGAAGVGERVAHAFRGSGFGRAASGQEVIGPNDDAAGAALFR